MYPLSPRPAYAPPRPVPGRPAPRPRRRDPAPSRISYRLQRLWLTPLWRRLLRVGLPAFLLAMGAGLWLGDPDRRAALTGGVAELVEKVQTRDEFMVHTMRIDGASEAVDKALRAMLPKPLPASSFDLDLAALRERALRLDAVESVDLRILPGGALSAVVTERQPALLWRHPRGIDLLDRTGHRVASITAREMRPDLPMIAGEGASAAADEALTLIDAAGPVLPRLRGLERIGQRRWDVVLDGGQRVLLPAEGALPALKRVLDWQAAEDVLGRDVAVVDMRLPGRPTLRLNLGGRNLLRAAQGQPPVDADGNVVAPEGGGAGTPAKAGKPAAGAKKKKI